ncbi:Nop12 protein [Candida orthopsilosis Co 90-125]|uniref:Nucleolar protein 12 n=1 Tax=Candida orthopsilosis (strain 90-125) TaxID=1136231 RepID=H8WXB2_CANO9|nr:Nop12 protein [Candida orthopsilosis Co 90-125]CCG21417.1 Nop12 protein [Candida orthopsilosis Co 90-125]
MSGFTSLFAKSSDKYDSSISELFKNSADGPISKDQLIEKKRTIVDIPNPKKHKHTEKDVSGNEDDEEAKSSDLSEESEEQEEEEEIEEERLIKKTKKKDENDNLEAKYFEQVMRSEEQEDTAKDEDESKEEKVSDEGTPSVEKESKKTKAAQTIDFKEEELEKAERTVFVGNVPSDVITSKTTAKNFKKLFKEFGKIDSIRFRSISFGESLPRKVSFAKKSLHESRDSVNAYIVFAEKSASLTAKKLNATVFENHHLRVDHVAHPAPKDNKRTIFVGNLDFEEKEESLWTYFNDKLDNDVESVRIIRDSKTNMGKGFALVQFNDTLTVNKALMLNDKPMKVTSGNKKARKLRISRAKSNAKPSLMSPNHIENVKKAYASNKSREQQSLTDNQRTKLGRAQSVLGKADRSRVGKPKKVIIEGERATKGSKISGIKGLKSGKVKKPRIRDRSTKFKNEREAMKKEVKK